MPSESSFTDEPHSSSSRIVLPRSSHDRLGIILLLSLITLLDTDYRLTRRKHSF